MCQRNNLEDARYKSHRSATTTLNISRRRHDEQNPTLLDLAFVDVRVADYITEALTVQVL